MFSNISNNDFERKIELLILFTAELKNAKN